MIYLAGRALQLMGLIAMPSAMWVGWIGHNERGSIGIFLGSIIVFLLGYFLTSISGKKS